MGGSAIVIYGDASARLTGDRPVSRTIVDRLLGRTRMATPAWSQIGPRLEMLDLPAADLEGLGGRFVAYLEARLQPPWAATSAVLQYLRLGVLTAQVRGARSGDKPPEWYLQLTFSACAGTASISAELAAHWAELWYLAEQRDLASLVLRPYGFEPGERIEPGYSDTYFVPLGAAGYAHFTAAPGPVDDDDDPAGSRYFEIDGSALESRDDRERAELLQRLDEELPPLLPANSCCCQMCAPDFDIARLDRAVPFR